MHAGHLLLFFSIRCAFSYFCCWTRHLFLVVDYGIIASPSFFSSSLSISLMILHTYSLATLILFYICTSYLVLHASFLYIDRNLYCVAGSYPATFQIDFNPEFLLIVSRDLLERDNSGVVSSWFGD